MSEQDFFFDEEPQAKQPAGKKPKPKAPAAPSAPETKPEASSSFADQSTTWAVASLVGVAGLLLGAIIGFLLGTSVTKTATPAVTAPITATSPSAAPSSLTSEQIQGGLPAGHPDISKPATGSTDATK